MSIEISKYSLNGLEHTIGHDCSVSVSVTEDGYLKFTAEASDGRMYERTYDPKGIAYMHDPVSVGISFGEYAKKAFNNDGE